MAYQISKQFHFSAAHRLEHLPVGHPCQRNHGHNYSVEVVLEAHEVDDRGFVVDYGDLSPIKHWIDEKLDHRHLNEVLPELEGQTTAENLCRLLYAKFKPVFPQLAAVRISETPKTWAEYRQ
jgi:6-pyruvoyltetrahydropterin/6-carboxytetrahydropterin synthase